MKTAGNLVVLGSINADHILNLETFPTPGETVTGNQYQVAFGGKGANLAEMTNLGLPVPQGFTISTEACTQYYEDGRRINDEIQASAYANSWQATTSTLHPSAWLQGNLPAWR